MRFNQKSLIAVIVFIAVFLWSLAPNGTFIFPKIKKVHAAALTSLTVAPNTNNTDNLINQSSAAWKFTVNNVTALTALNTAVIIQFPTSAGQFNLSGLTATSTAAGGDAITFATSSLPVVGSAVTIMTTISQTSADNNFTITISGITNVLNSLDNFDSALGWSAYTCTLNQSGNPSSGCSSNIDTTVNGTAPVKRRGGAITAGTLTASSTSAAATTQYRLTFTASSTLAVGEKIWLSFPAGFNINNATTSAQLDINGSGSNAPRIANGAIATSSAYNLNSVIWTTSNAAINAGDTVTVTVGRIVNPSKGAYQGVNFFTTTSNSGLVDGTYYGLDSEASQNGPPPVDSIQIGGTNTISGTVKVKLANGTLRTVTTEEAAQLEVGMGCPDLMFFVGTKEIASDGTFTYTNVLDATYILFVMPITENSDFFQNYISPNMINVSVTGNETVSIAPTFELPNSFIAGSVTGGPASAEGIFIRAYTGDLQTFNEVFNSTSYTTPGLNGSGAGFFKVPVKSGNTWSFNVMTNEILTSGGTQYWTPDISPVYVPDTNTVTTTPAAFVVANKELRVTLTNSVDDSTITNNFCLSVRRSGQEMMGPMNGNEVCNAVNGQTYYSLRVPAGPFVIQAMAPGRGFAEYPVLISSDTATTTKTIIVESPAQYISGTVTDPDGFAMQGVSVFAQGSNGSFNQAMTNSSGVYTIYAQPGIYNIQGFTQGYGPLTPINNVILADGINTTGQNLAISAGDFKTIQGQVYTDVNTNGEYNDGTDTPYQSVQIFAFGGSGGNGTQTRSDGTYTLRVPDGTYTIGGWHEDLGGLTEAAGVDVSSDVTGQDFTVAAQGYLQIRITNGNVASLSPVFAGAFNSSGQGNGSNSFSATTSSPSLSNIDDLVAKFSLPAGNYNIRVGTPAYGELTSLPANSGVTSAVITAGAVTNVTLVLPTLYALSGTAAASANVWASRTDGPGKYNATADSNGDYSMKIPAATYMIGANLTGYINLPTQTTIAADTTVNLTLTASEATISGTVSSGGTPLSEGFIWAIKGSNQGWQGTMINPDGSYSLEVDDGSWTVYATGPCYYDSLGTTQTGSGTVSISLTAVAGCTVDAPEAQSVVPSSGGSISQTDVRVTIPPNALGTGSSAVTVNVTKPGVVPPTTLNAAPLASAAQSISAINSSGNAISDLNSAVEIELTYSDSDIPNGSSESNLQLAYWNTTTNAWDPVAATIDTTNNTITASVSHFTDFAPVLPTGDDVPSTPTGLTATRNSSNPHDQIDLSWTQVSGATGYVLYRDTSPGGSYPTIATIGSGSTVSYQNTSLNSNATYFYKITSSNSNGESAASSAVSASTAVGPSGSGGGGGGSTPPAAPETEADETANQPEAAPTADAPATFNGQVTVDALNGGSTTVTTDTGSTVKVVIPPNAVTTETTFAVSQNLVTKTTTGGDTATGGSGSSVVPPPAAGKVIIGGRSFDVGATAAGNAISQFSDSLTLILNYSNAEVAGVDESSLKISYYNSSDNAWVSLTSSVDAAANTITAYTNHLTSFAVIGALTGNPAAIEGKVVKSADSAAVYLINQGYRRAFTSEMMYFSYNYRWPDVVVTDISNIPQGPDMVYSDTHAFTAGQMIKGTNEKVYFIDNANQRHWVESEAVFLGLGYQWKQVAWISDAALGNYQEGASITSAGVRPDGSLIKYPTSDKVYLIEQGQKRWIENEAAFNSLGYGWYNIIIIPNDQVFVDGTNVIIAGQAG